MTVNSALERIDQLIDVSAQRLMPHALQRLTVGELLGGYERPTHQHLPAKEKFGITRDQEPAFNRLVKFLHTHEPTGHEKDASHKSNVVLYLTILEILQECQLVKLPSLQVECVNKLLNWFENTTSGTAVQYSSSASMPVLPPRMSPKKPMGASGTLGRSSSQRSLTQEDTDAMQKAQLAQKLEHYRMPDLRASHIRRVAQLRSRGADLSEDELAIPSPATARENTEDIPDPAEYEQRAQRDRIRGTFEMYEPETEAEFAMNQMWLEKQQEDAAEHKKAEEVRSKMMNWSLNKSRDESEYLRKQEATQLAARLDKVCKNEYDAVNPKRRHLEQKKEEWQAVQRSAPKNVICNEKDQVDCAEQRDVNNVILSSPNVTSEALGQPHAVVVVKAKKIGGGPGTPIGSGGMHFRNQLPASYTPQSRRSSNSSSNTPGSRDSRSTPSTPLSSSSSAQLQVLDDAATRHETATRTVQSNALLASWSKNELTTVEDQEEDCREQEETKPLLRHTARTESGPNEFKLHPFHSATIAQQGGRLARALSLSNINPKFFPPGTIPPQQEPLDPEYRHLYAAAVARKPPLPLTIVTDKPQHGLKRGGSATKLGPSNNQQESTTILPPTSQNKNVKNPASRPKKILPPSHTSAAHALLASITSTSFMSDLRAEQQQELERIRLLFEKHNLEFQPDTFERGLLIPEDKSALECALNLPLPGSRLIHNPLLQVKLRGMKKKKKKKGGKVKKKKGGKTGGTSKSPKKKKKM